MRFGFVGFSSRVLALAAILACSLRGSAAPPEDFPRFEVPGRQKEMSTLRELYWLH
jgi:hypothetical protein